MKHKGITLIGLCLLGGINVSYAQEATITQENCHQEALYPSLTLAYPVAKSADPVVLVPNNTWAKTVDGKQVFLVAYSLTDDGLQVWSQMKCDIVVNKK